MDPVQMRRQLVEAKSELARAEREYMSLRDLVNGLEGWLGLHGGVDAEPMSMNLTPPDPRRPPASLPRGSISIRQAIIEAIKQAPAEGLSSAELVAGVRRLGAQPSAKDPVRSVEALAYVHRKEGQPINRVDGRWLWVGQGGARES